MQSERTTSPLRSHGNPWTLRTQCVVDDSGSCISKSALRAHNRTSTRANAQRHEARGSQSAGCGPDRTTEATESLAEALLPRAHERPHEALQGDFPAERWQPSTKKYPSRLPQPEYPGHFEVRRVSPCGTFRLSGRYFLSNGLKGEDIGLEEVGDDVWNTAYYNIVYYNTVIGRIDIQRGKITGSEYV